MNNVKKYKFVSSVAIAIAVVLVIVVNVFVSVLNNKLPLKIDLTSNKMYELSDKTKEYLKNYDTPVDIYILAGESEQDGNIRTVLDKYAAANKNINVTNINMTSNPTFGKKYVTDGKSLQSNSVIVDGGDKFKTYTMTELYGVNAQTGQYTSLNVENKITSALKYVSSETQQTAYLIKGHNEIAVDGAKTKLESENFEVGEVNTLTDDIPSDANMLIVAKPTADFSKEEITKLDSYLQKGGNIQVYLDVDSKNLTNLYDYLKSSWGIGVSDNLVIETDTSKSVSLSGSSMSLVVPNVKSYEFTDSIIDNQRTLAYFPYSRLITQEFESNGDISVTPVLTSSEKAYTTSNYENVSKVGGEQDGEYPVSELSVDAKHASSVYVSGNTMLLTIDETTLTNNYGLANYDYFMNLTNFMIGNEESFTVDEKTLVNNVITLSDLGQKIIFAFVVISPATITLLPVSIVSTATLDSLSCLKHSSNIVSDIKSATLSGCPSVTLSLVKKYLLYFNLNSSILLFYIINTLNFYINNLLSLPFIRTTIDFVALFNIKHLILYSQTFLLNNYRYTNIFVISSKI